MCLARTQYRTSRKCHLYLYALTNVCQQNNSAFSVVNFYAVSSAGFSFLVAHKSTPSGLGSSGIGLHDEESRLAMRLISSRPLLCGSPTGNEVSDLLRPVLDRNPYHIISNCSFLLD